jgi:hypothetical protein
MYPRPWVDDLPSDEEGLKKSHSSTALDATLGMAVGENGEAAGLRLEASPAREDSLT